MKLTRLPYPSSTQKLKNFEGHLQRYKHNREHAPSIWTSPSLSTALISAASCWADIKHFALHKKKRKRKKKTQECVNYFLEQHMPIFSRLPSFFFFFFFNHDWKNTGNVRTLVLLCPTESAVGGEIGTSAATGFSLLNVCANCWVQQDSLNWRISNYESPERLFFFLLI